MSNLQQRVITAICLAAGLLVVLFVLPPRAAALAFAALAALAAWEWAGLMRQGSPARVMYAFVLLLFCWQIQVAAPELIAVLLVMAAIFWILIVPLWLVRKWTLSGNDFFGYLIGFLVILPTWAALLQLHASSPWLLLAVMALVWVADIAAYFSGRRFGKHKLAPAISPGKTWEGVGGAVLGVVLYGGTLMTFAPLAFSLPWLLLVAGLLLLTAVSIAGDLFESLLKRQAGLKDSSALLPGHGGVLDRIDSLTSTLPLAALLLQLAR
ncbi:MAG: phosphatidate cytidylyltransferase [Betaproteobacteria bacterium HGW-Betaproteobacteria-11]|nr:MAG: phosphatidate cytidylyltransferase [Betaproteobacteria bacterium HGW-Betaproteobacteria-11]